MTRDAEKLLAVFGGLDAGRRKALLAFAEKLSRQTDVPEPHAQPREIARPPEETVVMAIRRLVGTYPGLNRRRLMGEASRYMAQHALEDRAAREVIDELERLFARQHGERAGRA